MKGNCKSKRIRWDKVLLSMVLWHLAFYLVGCVAKEEESRYPEVEKYLFDRFEVLGKYSGNYYIEEISENGEVYYRVTEKEGEKLEFRVFPVGDEYTKAGFDDTCPVAFVMKKAGETGLVLEPGDGEKELVATIDGYGEIEELAEKLARIAGAYEKAGLPARFTSGTKGDGWNCADIRVEIRGFSPEGYEPEVIHIPDNINGIHGKEEIQKYLQANYLTYMYRYYLGEIPGEVPKESLRIAEGEPDGITVESGERVTEYPNLEYDDLYFAQVYHLACEEGWEVTAEENSFTITAEGQAYRFELVFEERDAAGISESELYFGRWEPRGHALNCEPAVYWYPAEGEGRMPASSEKARDKASISADILEQITGARLESGLRYLDEEERIREIQDEVDGYLLRSDVKQIGESAEIAGWHITLKQTEAKKRIEEGDWYLEADEGKIFVLFNLEVENQTTQKQYLFESVVTPEELQARLISSGGHRDIPTEVLYLESDMINRRMEPGEVARGNLIFHMDENILQEDETVFLVLHTEDESQVFRIQ